jgi:hypothetical protein
MKHNYFICVEKREISTVVKKKKLIKINDDVL